MKDSGVEWLGDVPTHWDVRRLGQFGRLSKGNGGNKEDEIQTGVPCVRYGDLYTTHTYFIEKSRSFVAPETARNYTSIAFGDVLFAASGETIEEIGKSAVNLIQAPACCGGDVILFRPQQDLVARYMGYATDCSPCCHQKATMGRGITVKHIYGDQLKYLVTPLPPLPAHPALHPRQTEADHAAGGVQASHHPPGRYARPRPQRPPQALRRGVAGRRAGALGGTAASECRRSDNRVDLQPPRCCRRRGWTSRSASLKHF